MTTVVTMAVSGSIYKGGAAYDHHGGTNEQDALRDGLDATWVERIAINPTALIVPLDLSLLPSPGTKTLQQWVINIRQRRLDVNSKLRVRGHVISGTSDKVVGNTMTLSNSNAAVAPATTVTGSPALLTEGLPTHLELTDLTPPERAAPDVPYEYHQMVYFVAAFVTATFADPPACTVVGPTGSLLGASPDVSWTFTSNEGLGQTGWAYAVYPQAVYSAAGFTAAKPTTDAAMVEAGAVAWASGSDSSTSARLTGPSFNLDGLPHGSLPGAFQPTIALPLGNYRVFVWVQETLPTGVINAAPVASSDFSITSTPPAAPYFATGWDDAAQAAQLLVVGRVNQIDEPTAGSESGAGTWTGTNVTVARLNSSVIEGLHAMRATVTANGTATIRSGKKPVKVGAEYLWAVTFATAPAARTVNMVTTYYDASNASIAVGGISGLVLSAGAAVTLSVTEAPVPPLAVTCEVRFDILSAVAAEQYVFDAFYRIPAGQDPAFSVGGLGSPRVQVQRSIDNGQTWVTVRRVAGEVITDDDGVMVDMDAQTYVANDYEVPRGMVVDYRARVIAEVAGAVSPSPWVVATAFTGNDGQAWLKDVTDPSLNMPGLMVLKGSTSTQLTRQQVVFRIIDRWDPVVINGALGGQDGAMTVWPEDMATYEAFVALLECGDTLLWQEPHVDSGGVGLQRYVKIVHPASWRGRRPPFTSFDVSFVEVAGT